MALTDANFIEVSDVQSGNKRMINAAEVTKVDVGPSDRRLITLVTGEVIHVSNTYANLKTALGPTVVS